MNFLSQYLQTIIKTAGDYSITILCLILLIPAILILSIDQILLKAPQYKLLQNIKPGITSWGQVKYGYVVCWFIKVQIY